MTYYLENYNLENFSVEEKSFIMGTLLGDGHLQKHGANSFRLKIAHSIKQKQYVEWKHDKLKRFCTTTKGPTERVEAKGVTVRFETGATSEFSVMHSLFYKQQGVGKTGKPKYVKIITQELIEQLPMNPYVLALWYMDDGSVRDDCNAGKLATQGFSLDENKLLSGYLEKWGIKANVIKHTVASGQYYIGLPAATFSKFTSIIKPIVSEIPSMLLKLGNNV
jgi:hypothetical protein